jgi:hypothetical protein
VSTAVIIILIVVIVGLLVASVFLYLHRKRSERLRETFGSEYDREVADAPNRATAEKGLQERQKRHRMLDIRPLEHDERAGYHDSWEQVQRGFVDSPSEAVREADRLVIAIMATRGYPTDDFDQRADDMSVEHPDVVEHYRRAHQVAVAHERGDADTEQLRQAAISYRSLVQALLGDHAHPDHGQGDQARGDRIHDDRANGDRSENDRSDEQSRPGATKANGNQQQTATTTSTNRSDA